MSTQFDKLEKCYEYCKTVTDFIPRVGLILGSGLGGYAKNMKVVKEISYDQIPGFPVSTVQGHDGKFLLGYIGKVPAMVMKGRVHFYEGYTPQEVVLPVRLMKRMGIEILFLTNASGGINRDFQVGDFMMITDHISSFVPSPLIGENVSELGERFPDMTKIYDANLNQIIEKTAAEEKIILKKGVYLQTSGPNFEAFFYAPANSIVLLFNQENTISNRTLEKTLPAAPLKLIAMENCKRTRTKSK